MEAPHLNWIAIFIAPFVGFILNLVWYSDFCFGKAWLKLIGKTRQEYLAEVKQGSYVTKQLGLLVSWFVAGYLTALFAGYFRVFTWDNALIFAVWVSLAFVWGLGLPLNFTDRRVLQLFCIHAGFLSLLVFVWSMMFALWR